MLYLAASVAIPIVGIGVYLKFFRSSKRPNYPKDIVYAHIGPRGPYAPSLSPFAIKLELFMKITNIEYEGELHDIVMSSKGKFPWISYNEDDVTDSQFSIEYMKRKFKVDLDHDYTPAELAIGRAMQKMAEENLYWCLVLERWVYQKIPKLWTISKIPQHVIWIVKKGQIKNAYGQGMGRHTEEEVFDIARRDLKALSDFLGDKKFLLGDKITEFDCAIFGLLCQIYYHSMDGCLNAYMTKELKNLCDYVLRVKETFWPDWNECVQIQDHSGKKTN
ncbi:DgyrCDS2879 [Dimorphilus gyrociliatus]|uniref:DgyrCDS2879 n=1 Tax=Dimorphilus gyrociliatus TaxID=2664684 RepID=A0A7I8VBK5_9ANNE|nr:DgyrCDS2879 [Dimorphilus gyrociliatus]